MRHPPSPIYESKSGRTTLSLVFTILITGGLFIILPLAQLSSEPPKPDDDDGTKTILVTPPPKPPDPPKPDDPDEKPDDEIEMDKPAKKLSIRDVTDHFRDRGPGDGGVMSNFRDLDFTVENLIYETDDLDSHPKLIVQSNPAYPSALKRGRIEGYVEIVFVVTADGKVRNVRISKASHREFAESVRNAVRQWSFEPGKLNNKAVATRVRQSFHFTLK